MQKQASGPEDQPLDVLIVGAGWSGMFMLHRTRQLGLRAKVLEGGPSVGGTWYWNRYPGLRCDVESMEYSFSFDEALQQEWVWSERYASQAEILRYAHHVADRFDLRRDIELNKHVKTTYYDDATELWTLGCADGTQYRARYVVLATGCLSVPKIPDIDGVSSFRGQTYYTTNWPEQGVDFSGKRVAVIGTGSSGIQAIPIIAEQAAQLYIMQRTPSYSMPAYNVKLTPEKVSEVKSRYAQIRADAKTSLVGMPTQLHGMSVREADAEERKQVFAKLYDAGLPFAYMTSYADLLVDETSNRIAAEFIESKIRERVKDPAGAEQLIPKDQHLGTRRMCIDTNYYETFNRDNVALVNLQKEPIVRITERGVQTKAGEYEVDCIVFATGYDAMTGSLLKMDIRGRKGQSLREKWKHGPRTMLGLTVAGFPNLFTITGPGSPSVLSNMMVSIEQHIEWVSQCIGHLESRGLRSIEATAQAEEEWTQHVQDLANQTLFPRGNTWYMGANVPGKPRLFLPYLGVGAYRQACDEIAAAGYKGFALA